MSNILIQPTSGILEFNTGVVGSSSLDTSLSGASRFAFNSGELSLTSYSTNNLNRFSIYGINGPLLLVDDSVSGSLFSINTIGGNSLFEVFSDGLIRLGPYGKNLLTVSGSSVAINSVPSNDYLFYVNGPSRVDYSLETPTLKTDLVQSIISNSQINLINNIIYLDYLSFSPIKSIDFGNRILYTNSADVDVSMLDWNLGKLYSNTFSGPELSLDWQNRILSGNWSLSGKSLATGGPYSPTGHTHSFTGISAINVSGRSITGNTITVTGLGNVYITTGINGIIQISGNGSSSSNGSYSQSPWSGDVDASGRNLTGVTSISGKNFSGNYGVFASGLTISGQPVVTGVNNYFTGLLTITGANYINVSSLGSNGVLISGNTILNDSNGLPSLDLNNRYCVDSSNYASFYWQARTLIDTAGATSIDWQSRVAKDSAGQNTINYNTCSLSSGAPVALRWNTKTLSGIWTAGTGLNVIGIPVVTGITVVGVNTLPGPSWSIQGINGISISTGAGSVIQVDGSAIVAGVASQTPWASNINASGYNLTGATSISGKNLSGNYGVFASGLTVSGNNVVTGGPYSPTSHSHDLSASGFFTSSNFTGITTINASSSLVTGNTITITGLGTVTISTGVGGVIRISGSGNTSSNYSQSPWSGNVDASGKWLTGATSISGTNISGDYGVFASGLTVSGKNVATGGPYYPTSNPSGYIATGYITGTGNATTYVFGSTLYISGNSNVASLSSKTGALAVTGAGLVQTYWSGINTLVVSGVLSIPSIGFSSSPTTATINWALGNTFYHTLSGITDFGFLNTKDGQTIVVLVRNTGVNSHTVNWPPTGTAGAPVKWPSGVSPTQSSGKHDVYTFIQIDTGIYGNAVQMFAN